MSSMEGEGTPFIAPSAFHQTPNGLHINTMSHPQIGRNNVSVTNIKCEDGIRSQSTTIAATTATAMTTTTTVNGNNSSINTFFNGGIRISVPKTEDSDSDTELSNIENLKVNRRQNSNTNNGPRPMSWEGELSEPEDIMDTENCTSNDQKFLGNMNTQMSIKSESQNCDIIKPDLDQISVDVNTSLYPPNSKKIQNDPINLKYEPGLSDATSSGLNSPLLARSKANLLPANPSPDSAIHSVYTHSSPSQSPLTSRHAPYTPSLSRNNSDASHSSCYSYSSEFSPTHSPIQGRHNIYGNFNGPLHHSVLYRPILDNQIQTGTNNDPQNLSQNGPAATAISNRRTEDVLLENDTIPSAGISRQQLINSPCPICGDKISGFHYGIFSCESCKGFFKRTVQNRKNYVCVRGGPCPVTISTRKKCPACRFDKCLQKGMKLEAIREDRTRGGRSTYQCSYTLPNSMLNPLVSPESIAAGQHSNSRLMGTNGFVIKTEQSSDSMSSGILNSSGSGGIPSGSSNSSTTSNSNHRSNSVPTLLQEIMDVEHLWQYNEAELSRLNQPTTASSSPLSMAANTNNLASNPLLASAGLSSNGEITKPDLINLCNVADHRLYKIVKWCKSLPLFKNISIDDQICLLINSWCELLLFSCCFRSVDSHGEIKISLGKSITLAQAKTRGLQACIERMLNLTDHLRRLRVDRYEYVAMKVIVLLQSDTSELREPVKVRESQEKALQALQSYTLAHYSDTPAKFGELLLRIPELQRTCQLGKEMLTIKSRDGEDFNLLMELLRGEH